MRPTFTKLFSSLILLGAFMVCSGFTPAKDPIKGDSLVIVRVLQPLSLKQNVDPVVFISQGLNRIESVEMRDINAVEFRKTDVVQNTLDVFLLNGYTLENSTEVLEEGFQLSTFYLKKKLI
ncbi:MAG: hypothetical protein ACI97X_000470 [Oceanospirillaceae bacterium]|jgi:hypothetical protein